MKQPMMSSMPVSMPPTKGPVPTPMPAPMPPTKGPMPGRRGFAKGGVTRGDGCVSKGHTKGKMR